MGGEGGPKRKTATHPLPPIAEQGKGAGLPVAARFGRAGLGRRPGTRGKGEGRCSGGDPDLTLGWGGAQRRGDVSRRRRAGMAAAAALQVRRGARAGG